MRSGTARTALRCYGFLLSAVSIAIIAIASLTAPPPGLAHLDGRDFHCRNAKL